MGYESNVVIAVELPVIEGNEDLQKIYNLFVTFDATNQQLAYELLLGLSKQDKDIKANYTDIKTILWLCARIEDEIASDNIEYGSNILVFEWKWVHWYDENDDVQLVTKIYNKLSRLTSTHFVRIGEDLDDIDQYGDLYGYIGVTRNISINI